MKITDQPKAGERGAVSIKTLLTFVVVGAIFFAIVKIVPIYTEQRQIIFDIDELANKSAVRNLKEEEVKKAMQTLREKYSLPENSIKLDSHAQNKVHLSLAYVRPIDFIVTTYSWKVDYKSEGKGF
jgi:hypothetical protein